MKYWPAKVSFATFIFRKETGKQYILTKGDNNQVDDRGLYNPGQLWIHREHIIGKVRG